MSSSRYPKIVLGTMEMGRQVDDEATGAQLEAFEAACGPRAELDTALAYCGGATQRMLARQPLARAAPVATKVNPWNGRSLSRDSILEQAEECLDALGVESVDLLYLHAPDHSVPMRESLRAMDELHRAGKFRRLGLSNYAAWQVVDAHHTCQAEGWVLPSVYQGMYNALTRAVEAELFPALRHCGMHFYAYNPLAGGLLTGKHKQDEDLERKEAMGRFSGWSWAANYRQRYWHDSYFAGVERIRAAAGPDVSLVDVALRWIVQHSQLGEGDAVILGASSQRHLEENLASCASREPLPAAVLEAIDAASAGTKADWPAYFR